MATEFVGIELQLRGYEGVMSDMQKLDSMLKGFRGQKNKLEIQSNLANAKKDIIAYRGELEKLKRIRDSFASKGIKSEGLESKIQEVTYKLRDAQQAAREFQFALKNLTQASFMQNFKKISSAVAHIGSAMQSAGNALTKLTNPFVNFTKGMAMGAGYTALSKFSDGLSRGFDRYDVMKKYPKIMKAFGYSAKESEKSINKLDKSVRGLPTGLDEMVDMTQRFTATTGDLDKGTKLAIATNNAFLASMSTDTQRYQGMMQLQDVLGGKDMNSREWNSLVSSMTPAIVKMGESLGYTSKNMSEFIQQIRDGKMSNEDFVDTLIKVGTKNGAVAKMAQESKDTWQAFFSNIGNAAARMTAGVIQSLDEITQMAVGKDVNQFLATNVTGAIDDMTQSLKGWIKAHPEEITDFFKSLGSINWGSIVKGFGDAALKIADLVKAFADAFGGKDLSWIGKGMIYGNVLGNFLTIAGGLLKGSRHIFGGLGAGGMEVLKELKSGGGLKGIISTMFTGSKGGDVAEAGKEIAKGAGSMGKISSGLSSIFKGWGQIATMVGGTALVGWGSFKAFKSMFKDLGEIAEICKDIDWKVATPALAGMGGFLTAFIGLGTKVGNAAGVAGLKGGAIFSGLTLMFSGTFWADMAMIKRGFKAIDDMAGYLTNSSKKLSKLKKIKDVGTIKATIRQLRASFNQISNLLMGEKQDRNNPVFGEVKREGGLKGLDSETLKNLKNVSGAIDSMVDAVKGLKKLAKVDLSGIDFTTFGETFPSAVESVGLAIAKIPYTFSNSDAATKSMNLQTVATNLSNSISSILSIVKQIPEITSAMGNMANAGTLNSMQVQMEQLGQTLSSVYSSLQGIGNGTYFASNIDAFRAGLKSMKFAIMHLKEISSLKVGNGIVSKIQTIISNIQNAFSSADIGGLTATIQEFHDAIQTALDSFAELNKEIVINASFKLAPAFYSTKRKVISEIKKAKNEIRRQRTPISFSIPVRVTFSVITNAASALARISNERQRLHSAAGQGPIITGHMPHTGGYIGSKGVQYRAKGGSIFKPKGTDTVPAMLTPGEYVQRRAAVNHFGIDFMRKINQLDVKGAMNALMAKAGAHASVANRQTTITNNTYNNQRVTITNNGNTGAGFAFRNASRFVGAF